MYKIHSEVWVINNGQIDNCVISRLPLNKNTLEYEVTSLKTLEYYEVPENNIFTSQRDVIQELEKRKESSHIEMGAF